MGGLIAGVTSYGYYIPGTWLASTTNQSSFGTIGAEVNVALYSGWIDSITGGSGAEILVNSTTAGDQKWSSVAIDTAGDFVVTWTSYGQDDSGNTTSLGNTSAANGGNGVYAQRFNGNGTRAGGEFRVNTYTAGNQQYSKVAMDAAGDFTIVWESFQDPKSDAELCRCADQLWHLRPTLRSHQPDRQSDLFTGPNGEYETEFSVNTTQNGDQRLSEHRHGRQRRRGGGLERQWQGL